MKNEQPLTARQENIVKGCGCTVALLCGWMIILLAILCCSSCKTIQREIVTVTQTDTTYIDRLKLDSIFLHDSTFIEKETKGDTVYLQVSKWKTKYVERLKVDSVYIEKCDTVKVIEEKEIVFNNYINMKKL